MKPPAGSMNAPRHCDMQTPPPQKNSKAASKVPQPNFTGTPNSAPPRRHWARRVTPQVVSVEKTIDKAARLKAQREKRDEAIDYSDQSEAGSSTYNTPLVDKPLPPRPIAQLANLQSPSKDSRSLIDATESPPKASSPSGAKREWQTLTPARATPTVGPSTVKSEASDCGGEDSKAPSPVSPVTSASVVAAAARLTKQIPRAGTDNEPPSMRCSLSPASSYASATESSIIDSYKDEKAPVLPSLGRKLSAPVSTQRSPLLQKRASFLRGRISSGSVIPREYGGKCDAFTDFTKEASPSPPAEDSRPHSPSAQSFSQPRPNNSFPKAPSGNIKTAKTSSRVPVNEGKKATVVDIPPRASQNSPQGVPQLPKFGNRRLDSKTADLLDSGIKRRQLQRTHTAGSAKRTPHSRASIDMSNPPTLNTPVSSADHASAAYSSTDSDRDATVKSDEDMIYAQSSCTDTSEVTTPLDQVHPPDEFLKALRQQDDQHEEDVEDKPWDHPHLSKASMPERCSDKTFVGVNPYPPSTSQHTNPLQTIPSQVDLHASFGQDGDNINHALSQLEGRGNQSRDDVNSAAVDQMFGHLKDVWVKPEASQLRENAATAERFLAMQEGGSRESPVAGPSSHPSPFQTFGQNEKPVDDPSTTPPPFSKFNQSNRDIVEPEGSKWSNTTPTTTSEWGAMEDGSQLPNNNISQQHTYEAEPEPEPRRPPPPPPKDRRRSQKSIGFPSSVAHTAETLTSFSDQDAAADVPNIPHRGSSPTLGKTCPGSSRAARESMTMSGALPGFAQPTKAAEARKISRLPTPSARTSSQQRGRSPVLPSQYVAGRPKSPRARSKSRYVLNKLNGLFLGKRDKKSIGSPHVLNGRDDLPALRSRLPVSRYDAPAREVSPSAPPVPLMSKPTKYNPRGKDLKNKGSETTIDTAEETLVGDAAVGSPAPKNDLYGMSSIHDLTDRLVARARGEREDVTKQHLLNFAQALNASLLHAREAQISAEQAEQAAKRAHASQEMQQKALRLVQTLAAGIGDAGAVRF